MTRGTSGWKVLVCAVLAVLGGCDLGGSSFMSVGTGGTGGIYYPLGGAIASRLSALDSEGRSFTAEVTGGSVENLSLLQRGDIDVGITISTSAVGAHAGEAPFSAPFEDLRIVAPLYPNVVNVLVPRGSDAQSPADFEGQRVSVGAAGSGTEQVSRALLEAYDLTYDDVRERFLTFGESSAGLRDGSIDAAIISVGYPASAVMEVLETGEGRLLPVGGERAQALMERHPHFFESVIPAGSYRDVEEDIPTVAEWNWIVARSDLDDEVVRNVLQVVTEERDRLVRVTSIADQIDMEALRSAPIPLHPATEAWLEENP